MAALLLLPGFAAFQVLAQRCGPLFHARLLPIPVVLPHYHA